MATEQAPPGFTQLPRQVFNDPRISGLAMGVYGHIATHRDGYGITPESIARSMRNGVTAVKTALGELETHGYLARTRTRRDGGTLGPLLYTLSGGETR